MKQFLNYLQRMGKALMLPIAALPVAGLMLRFGVYLDIQILTTAGDALFANLPLLFAIGVATGIAKDNHGSAALSGTVGYLVMTNVVKVVNEKNDMKVLAGMIIGVVAGELYNRYHDIKLPDWLGFFGGKRFVPIITSLCAMVLGIFFGYTWPPIQAGIDGIGNWIIGAGSIGYFAYGTLNRLLIPVGLHHILNSLVWFVFGEFNGATGDLNRFFAGDPTAGAFMTGFFPIMMFGLPAACLAMIAAAKKENRKFVSGGLVSVALTAFLTGITEPIEFLFMFLAPVLYVVHAILTGLSLVVVNALGIRNGFSFSAGLVDYLINLPVAGKPLLLVLVGLVFGVIYFLVFYFAIIKFDLKTPGREDEELEDHSKASAGSADDNALASSYLEALGGMANLKNIDACITRLRLTIADPAKVNEAQIKKLGASGIIKPSADTLQIVVGTKAESLAERMKKMK